MSIFKRPLTIIIFALIFILLFLFVWVRGPEDTWLCQDGQWVRHGNPRAPQPTGVCPGKSKPIKSPETSQPEETKTIETKNGDNFSVVLGANPSTGYTWELDFDAAHIQLINRKYTSSSKLPGAGGTETFNFLALKSGETKITFSYLRLWEKEKAAKELVYKIVIK